MSIELQYLIFAVFLVLLQMVLQSASGFLAIGLKGAVGSRDDEVLTTGFGGRFERAYYNMLETFPIFVALVLTIHVTESWDTTSALAVKLYFWARVAYIPLYVSGIPFLRSIAWIVSIAGILMLAWPLLGQVT